MTHGPETGAINRLHFFWRRFEYVCRTNLGPDSSNTRFRRRLEHYSIPTQKVPACSDESYGCRRRRRRRRQRVVIEDRSVTPE